MRHFVLASGSPRRIAFLSDLGLRPEVVPAQLDERVQAGEQPSSCVLRLAREKAAAVQVARPDSVVLAADTVVAVDGEILGKPVDEVDFARMMRLLSGRTHEVWTGVAVIAGGTAESAAVRTLVTFQPLTDRHIEWYWRTGEPKDKAGGYALQGLGGNFIERIEGSATNVVGLPMVETLALLRAAGIPSPWERQ